MVVVSRVLIVFVVVIAMWIIDWRRLIDWERHTVVQLVLWERNIGISHLETRKWDGFLLELLFLIFCLLQISGEHFFIFICIYLKKNYSPSRKAKITKKREIVLINPCSSPIEGNHKPKWNEKIILLSIQITLYLSSHIWCCFCWDLFSFNWGYTP